MPVVDTMMHTSTIRTVVDTKTYIDNHTQDVNFVCFRPEDYGAKGDGIANDSAALQACINAAQAYSNETGVCIRGYGTYKLNTGIVFNCRELDVYINKIIYAGSDAAVQLSASFSRFEFQSIRAYTGGNNAVCIRCYQSLDSGYTTTFHSNVVTCSFMRSSGNCVEFAEASGLTQHTMMYNDFYCQYQRSDNANIFAVLNRLANEINCYGKYVCAQNGYLLYYDKTHDASGCIRMFYYCLETDLKNGTNGEGRFYYCRFRELTDKQSSSDRTIGRVYKWENTYPQGEIVGPTKGIDLTSVDVTNADSWEDCIAKVKAYYEEHPDSASYDAFFKYVPLSGASYAKFDVTARVANAHLTPNSSMTTLPVGTMYVYYDNIAFKPHDNIYQLVNSDMTIQLSSTNGWTYLTPTTFDINTTSATITLDTSYCCIAINEFDVIQHEGKTAIVVDKLGNTIFNGTNRGPGRFHFKCDFVPYQENEVYVTLDNGTVKYLSASLLPGLYSGYNEQWSVVKYVDDGSVTKSDLSASLADEIDNKAAAIIVDTSEEYAHDLTINQYVNSISFKNGSTSFGKYLFADKLHVPYDKTETYTLDSVAVDLTDNCFVLNGTCGGTYKSHYFGQQTISGLTGNYKLYVITSEQIKMRITFVRTVNNTTTNFQVATKDGQQGLFSESIDMTDATKYEIMLESREDKGSYTNAKIWFGLFPADVTITNTNINTGIDTLVTIGSSYRYIDTIHSKSIVNYIADTKQYVDNLDINIFEELPFVTPELFGAVGDGSTDDTTSLQSAITAAAANNIPMRGYGKYKTTSMVVVTGSQQDIFINELLYYGNSGAALCLKDLDHSNISLVYIRSTANGLRVHGESSNGVKSNSINIKQIYAPESGFDGVEFIADTSSSIYNNTFTINHINANRNCYSNNSGVSGGLVNETHIYETRCMCTGWSFYAMNSVCLYGVSMESTAANGLYNTTGSMYACRYTEMIDKLIHEGTSGMLFRIEGNNASLPVFTLVGGGKLYYKAVDVSNVTPFSELTTADQISHRSMLGRIISQIAYGDNGPNTPNGYFILGKEMLIQGNHKICVPAFKSCYEITDADFDMRDSAGNCYPYVTDFKIGVADCVIHLPDSYCSLGYNEFRIIQDNSYKCIVYGLTGDVVFDGTNLSDGIYNVSIVSDVATPISDVRCLNIIEYDIWTVTDQSGNIVSTYQWSGPVQ